MSYKKLITPLSFREEVYTPPAVKQRISVCFICKKDFPEKTLSRFGGYSYPTIAICEEVYLKMNTSYLEVEEKNTDSIPPLTEAFHVECLQTALFQAEATYSEKL